MKHLHKLNLKIYWTDYTLSSIFFIIFFYFTFTTGNTLTFILSSIFLYRMGAFTHELAHQNLNKRIQPFKRVWNATTGFLILQPSLRFVKPHLKHHTTGIFATKDDPQYPLVFSNFRLAAIIFLVLPWFLPIYNFIVCLLTGLGMENTRWHSLLYPGITYTIEEQATLTLYEKLYSLSFILIAILNPALIITFYLVSVGAWYLSVLRIPLEHPLNEYKKTSTMEDQEVLSMTHESFIYIPVQPLALRFHTLHHMQPKIPYHNLKKGNDDLRNGITIH